jgi:hypothetical protein
VVSAVIAQLVAAGEVAVAAMEETEIAGLRRSRLRNALALPQR